MALTLDSTLQTRMDSLNRRPIVEITSESAAALLPIQGNYFSSYDENETGPNIIYASTGRLITAYVTKDAYQDLKMYYTDTDRTEWTEATIYTSGTSKSVSICELTGGNIGVIHTYHTSNTYYLDYMIVTPTGTVVTSTTNITSTSDNNFLINPHVLTLANDTYLLVYPQGDEAPPDQAGNYYLNKRTSSNFTSWSAASAITLTGLSVNNYKNNPHLAQLSTGRIFLHFDYLSAYLNDVEINNIYGMYSDDNGSSWTTPYAVTSHTAIGESAVHPSIAIQADDDFRVVYTEKRVVRRLTGSMDGYPVDKSFGAGHLDLNADDDRLYIWACGWGTSTFRGLVEFDIANWEYVRMYHVDTSPAFESYPYNPGYGSGKYTCASRSSVTWVTDMELETITHYAHRLVKSNYAPRWLVNKNFTYGHWDQAVHHSCIYQKDGNNRLYLAFTDWHRNIGIGWIDLEEQKDPITGLYTYNEIWYSKRGPWPVGMGQGHHIGFYSIRYDAKYDWLIITTIAGYSSPSEGGGMVIMDPDSGAIIFSAGSLIVEQFPRDGCEDVMPVEKDGIMYLYFTFGYDGGYGWEAEKRGLGRIRMDDNSIKYFEPTWYSANEYKLHGLVDMDGDGKRLLMTCCIAWSGLEDGPGGVVIYHTDTDTWEVFNNNTVPGLLPSGVSGGAWGAGVQPVQYDPATGTIYAAHIGRKYGATFRGVIAFSEYGAFSVIKYADVINADTTPEYGTVADFSYYDFEYHPSIVYDGDDLLWGAWSHYDGDEYSLVWVNLEGAKNIEDFLDIASNISIKWDIEDPTKLSFTLSHGYLFDPQNLLSIYSPILRKGRKIKVKIGEMISDTEYWQTQGTYLVKEVSTSYADSKYPKIVVKCEDIRMLWDETEVVATTYYNLEMPETILEDILLDHADLESSEFSIPAEMNGRHDISHQFIDMTVSDMIKELLDHFMYFPIVDVDGVFEPRRLNLNQAVDNSYARTTLIGYSPDDSYSTFINRIIVKGMSNVYSEVLYNEDSITTMNGTVGWWGSDEDIQVWYSDDHEKTCRNPRLEIIQSAADFHVFTIGGGGGEWIASVDVNEQYVIVHIQHPDLTWVFVAACAAMIVAGISALMCDHSWSCGWSIFALALSVNVVTYILGMQAQYNYTLWARPIGYEKRTFQAQADDFEFQEQIDMVVPESFEDPFCYTVQSCQWVADNELSIVMAQRNRVKFDKVTHLQDEIGDKITVAHPYSGEDLNVVITGIDRTIKIGKSSIDKIEGWRIV